MRTRRRVGLAGGACRGRSAGATPGGWSASVEGAMCLGRPRSLLVVPVVVTALVALAGCSDDRPSADEINRARESSMSAGATRSPSPSPSPSSAAPSPSSVRTVRVPSAATKHTEAGANAFLAFFIEATGVAFRTADSSTLRGISGPKCSGCATSIRLADELKSKGQRLDRDAVVFNGQTTMPTSTDDRYIFDAQIGELASKVIDLSGREISANKPAVAILTTIVAWDGEGWFIEDARKVVG
jgi:hypothetical protein